MSKIFRHRKVWPFQLLLVGFIVWLAHGILAHAQADRKPVVIERAPLRFIKDPNPSFSAVAVDSDSNMLVVSDENMFRIMEYDRRTSTPARARLTEPKRVISGTSTQAEMICGVYIDPKTKEPLLEYPCWAAPVLSRRRLYLRSEDRLVCLNLAKR